MSMRDITDSHGQHIYFYSLLKWVSYFPLCEDNALTGCIFGHMKSIQMYAHMHTQSIAFRIAWIGSKVVEQNEANKI